VAERGSGRLWRYEKTELSVIEAKIKERESFKAKLISWRSKPSATSMQC